jgi:hypothetical protein
MPDPVLAEAIKEAYASAPADVIIYHTLEINHANFSQPIRVVRDVVDLTACLELTAPDHPGEYVDFIAYAFDIVPPEVSTTGVPECVIEIDNVSREILAQIELAMDSVTPTTVIYRQFISSDLSAPQNDPPLSLTIFSLEANVFRIRATAGFGNFANKKFGRTYSAEDFPGLVPL